jgi:uncharacterized protein
MNIENYITKITNQNAKSVKAVLRLLDEGGTIPFIARYRKEQTGNLDELVIQEIQDAQTAYQELEKRKSYILKAIEEKGQLTDSLREKLTDTYDLNKLEDLYLPYKVKRKTRAEKARQAGLEGLAKILMKQDNGDPFRAAGRFKSTEFSDEEAAINGACDIIAEWINENEIVRDRLRQSFLEHGVISSKLVKSKEAEAQKYRDFFDYTQKLANCPSYRLLAILRGVDEGFLRMKIEPNTTYTMNWLERFFIKQNNEAAEWVKKAIKDSYKRLLQPGLETETKNHFKDLADDQSIKTFATNLDKLLLAAPVGNKRVLAIDPGFKSGCKVVCLDENGDLLYNENIYPHPPQKDRSKAAAKISQLVQSYKIEVMAIGDGTAGRETEAFVKNLRLDRDVEVYVVREDGASIYSASSIAREEFPQYDVTVRGAVSIGRRLMDPLAELVKIDPKSLGVGQYQHDVNQTKLQQELDRVVLSAVNRVGVNLNTASKYLLAYVAGLGDKLAENIVAYRSENGGFKSRNELKKVPRLGAAAFQQCAGFLRIRSAKNPLDDSAIHPENYDIVTKIVKDLSENLETLIANQELVHKIKKDLLDKLTAEVGPYTAKDIVAELEKPGIDPRKKAKVLHFDKDIRQIEDLKIGMKLNGIVTNVTDFGAFVNIGIKENGLIHKTKLAQKFVQHPAEVIALHDHVRATVVQIDVERKRIGLSLIEA